MRKSVREFLLVLSLFIVLGAGSVAAKPLDKASPILANQVDGSLLSKEGILKENQIILWTTSNNITGKRTKAVAWAIPSDLSDEELSGREKLPEPLRKEVKAVGVVIMDELSICKNVKTVLYSVPIETNTRIGIFSTSENLGMDTIKESIVAALASETDEDKELTSKQAKVAAW